MASVKVLDSFDFVDDSRRGTRWPEEWFDGAIRKIPVDLLDVDIESEEVGKQLSMRRQSIASKAKGLGKTLKFNWDLDSEGNTRGCVIQAVKAKAAPTK